MTADGHALFDEHDYKLNLGVTRDKLGFIKITYDEFRTWYNVNGGFYPPSGTWYPSSESALGWIEGRFPSKPG